MELLKPWKLPKDLPHYPHLSAITQKPVLQDVPDLNVVWKE